MDLSVYIHIPFCRQKCGYCDFVSHAGAERLHEPYIAALCREIAGRGGVFTAEHTSVKTVFIGGGTPTCLALPLLRQLLAGVRQRLPIADGAEFTVEANPGTVDAASLDMLLTAGVNRLSLGIQSFDDRLLRTIGRIHRADDALRAIELARQAGFTNLSLDLMHGLPGQSLADYRDSLATAVSAGADHISAYSLIVEDNTPLAAQLERGELALPPEETDAAMFELSHDYLTAQGYEHYEVSNYARPGKRCRHNLNCWRYRPYIGFGVAACSFDGSVRSTNTADIDLYIKQLAAGQPPVADTETADIRTRQAEYVFLALRTVDGVDEADFATRFAVGFREYYSDILTNLMDAGLIADTAAGIRLTPLGLRFGNRVFAAFLP
ncbi:MAG: radical SAM family heme chaperone HemW [Sporomusaceae bacterium]|nr:radical SAM family heme chaperone HemW [Sporomusaceae bacterium]